MRVALLQLDLSGKSRAERFQRVGAAVDAAAAATPAPDLIVLPAGCDLIGVSVRGVTAACLDGFREFLSLKAREWGVFLAAGVNRWDEEAVNPCTIVLDPDGDVVIGSDEPANAPSPQGPSERFWCSSIGRLGVVDPTAGGPPARGQIDDLPAPVMIWPVAGAVTGRRRDRLSALRDAATVGAGRHWAIVVPAHARDGGGLVSFVTTSAGETIAVAPDGGAVVVTADLPVDSGEGE